MLKRFCQSANLATLSGCSCWNNEKITIHQAHTKQLMETEKETYEINQLKHRNKWHIWKSSWNWQRWKMMDAGGWSGKKRNFLKKNMTRVEENDKKQDMSTDAFHFARQKRAVPPWSFPPTRSAYWSAIWPCQSPPTLTSTHQCFPGVFSYKNK